MTLPLLIIPGSRPDTFTLGVRRGKKLYRDSRFAAFMSFEEAKWLLTNELRPQAQLPHSSRRFN